MSLSTRIKSAWGEFRGSMLGSPTTPLTALAAWNDLGGGPTSSGEIITEANSMAISTVFTCVSVLAEAVASLPCKLMRKIGTNRSVADDHYLYDILASEPNEEQSAFVFWSTMVGSAALCGNGYAQIMRDVTGQPESLWPLHPMKTEPVRTPDGTLAFRTSDGMKDGTYRIIAAKDVLHFPLFSLNGIKGQSPVSAAREAFALAKAMEKYGARWFANGATAPVLLINKGGQKPDGKAQQEFIESWNAAHSGVNQHRQGFLWGDWEPHTIGLSPEDSQFLTARNYQRSDIAAMFRIPPHMVGSLERLSNNNYEQQQLDFVTGCLRPILVRIEQELARKLLPKVGPNAGKLFVTFDLSERLRGDFATQMKSYAVGRQWGFLCVNDIRADLGMNNIGPEGDVFLAPVNMSNATQLLDETKDINVDEVPKGASSTTGVVNAD